MHLEYKEYLEMVIVQCSFKSVEFKNLRMRSRANVAVSLEDF